MHPDPKLIQLAPLISPEQIKKLGIADRGLNR